MLVIEMALIVLGCLVWDMVVDGGSWWLVVGTVTFNAILSGNFSLFMKSNASKSCKMLIGPVRIFAGIFYHHVFWSLFGPHT